MGRGLLAGLVVGFAAGVYRDFIWLQLIALKRFIVSKA